MKLEEALSKIRKIDSETSNHARQRWDSIAKPLRSLGILEEAIIKIAGITRNNKISLDKKALVIMCADNGVVEEGVTQTGQEVTAIVSENFTNRKATVSVMSKVAGVDLFPIDIGVYRDMECSLGKDENIVPFRVINRKVSYGTNNMLKGPAMTRAML